MWYVIQTLTGKEQETAAAIERILGKTSFTRQKLTQQKLTRQKLAEQKLEQQKFAEQKLYSACFVIRRECLRRIEGSYQLEIKTLFPSYVFIETETPKEFFLALRQVPKMTRLLRNGEDFWQIREEEERLLRTLMGEENAYVIRRSPVCADESGELTEIGGVLKQYADRIVKKRLRKRSVVIEIPFLGEVKRIPVGIFLKSDNII